LGDVWPRRLQLSSPVFGDGQTAMVTVELLAQGGENALGFSLDFDPQQWRFVAAEIGEDAPGGVLGLNVKSAANGRLGVALAVPPGKALWAGLRSLLVVKFVAAEGGGTLSPVLGFGDWPTACELVGVKADILDAEWTPAAGRNLVNVSAISYEQTALARGGFVAAFGARLATTTAAAAKMAESWPIELAGTTVTIFDREGNVHRASLLFVSPTQVNYQLPVEAATGTAEVWIISSDGMVSIGKIEIVN
jgi:hypothetical protein